MNERSLHAVPRTVLVIGALLFAAQIALRAAQPAPSARAEQLPVAPTLAQARLASLSEPVALAGLLALRLQSFDNQPGLSLPFASLDYRRVIGWLDLMLGLDPNAGYPLLMASHLYAQVPDPAKQRAMLEFTYQQFFADPNRRWRWLAHAALMARHRLGDLPLALRYARALRDHAHGPDVPHWATQMSALLLADMGELEAARVELGGLLVSGAVRDPKERHFLTERLHALEREMSKSRQ